MQRRGELLQGPIQVYIPAQKRTCISFFALLPHIQFDIGKLTYRPDTTATVDFGSRVSYPCLLGSIANQLRNLFKFTLTKQHLAG
jgi:hypothetical protein